MSNKNPPYARCEHCGATLDKGERCDCDASQNVPAIRLVPSAEEAAEAAVRKEVVMSGIGRRVPDHR